MKAKEFIEIVDNEPIIEIITENEKLTEQAYEGIINNLLAKAGK